MREWGKKIVTFYCNNINFEISKFFFFLKKQTKRGKDWDNTKDTLQSRNSVPKKKKKTRVIFNKTWTGTIPKKKKVKIRKDNIGIFKNIRKSVVFG